MFGLLVSGRLVDTSFREVNFMDSRTKTKSQNIINLFQVDNTHCVIDVDGSGSFNHLVVSHFSLLSKKFVCIVSLILGISYGSTSLSRWNWRSSVLLMAKH